jgi:uncharacterized protein YbjQ (UPF0145 family)
MPGGLRVAAAGVGVDDAALERRRKRMRSAVAGCIKEHVNHSMTTTAFILDGHRIVETKGIVRGIIVRSRSIFGTIGGSLQTLFGGNISLFTELCERTREDAFNLMIEHAREHGANAVIGVRYDATEVMGGVTEVLCYGTAVVVTPVAIDPSA